MFIKFTIFSSYQVHIALIASVDSFIALPRIEFHSLLSNILLFGKISATASLLHNPVAASMLHTGHIFR